MWLLQLEFLFLVHLERGQYLIIQNLQLGGGCASSLSDEGLALDCETKGIKRNTSDLLSISDFSVLGHHAFQFSQVCVSPTKLWGI